MTVYTPPQLGELWGVAPETIIGWIRSGELAAFNVAAKNCVRPRYRITAESLAEFQARRAVTHHPVQSQRLPPVPKEYV